MVRLRRECKLVWLAGWKDTLQPCRAIDVLAGLIAVAAVDASAGPDSHHVALLRAAFESERNLRPALLADRRLEQILRHIMRQPPALDLSRGGCHDQRENQGQCEHSHGRYSCKWGPQLQQGPC